MPASPTRFVCDPFRYDPIVKPAAPMRSTPIVSAPFDSLRVPAAPVLVPSISAPFQSSSYPIPCLPFASRPHRCPRFDSAPHPSIPIGVPADPIASCRLRFFPFPYLVNTSHMPANRLPYDSTPLRSSPFPNLPIHSSTIESCPRPVRSHRLVYYRSIRVVSSPHQSHRLLPIRPLTSDHIRVDPIRLPAATIESPRVHAIRFGDCLSIRLGSSPHHSTRLRATACRYVRFASSPCALHASPMPAGRLESDSSPRLSITCRSAPASRLDSVALQSSRLVSSPASPIESTTRPFPSVPIGPTPFQPAGHVQSIRVESCRIQPAATLRSFRVESTRLPQARLSKTKAKTPPTSGANGVSCSRADVRQAV